FQFGNGFGDLMIPTSAVTMSVLAIAEIPWEKWAKWVLPMEILLLVFGCIVLTIAVVTGYS
ncbi:MAG TPA: YfcC family protein, partial [Candidatus Sumerlaeota bacterium]|nr:YfcC family protein [Candidatus Sumerlaeota bacterium]